MEALVVGCGLCGSVIARSLAERGFAVEIWDLRDHIGGNMFDYVDEHGILVHKYGPHTFHTSKKQLYDYVCRFESWIPYKLTCGAVWDGKYTPTPFNFTTIDTFYPKDKGNALKARLMEEYAGRSTATVVEVLENENEDIREYARFLFQNDYAPYTAKQWGVSPDEIDPSVLKRVPLRFSYDEGYFDDEYQIMPEHSYSEFFSKLLSHPNISVKLNTDALDHIRISGNSVLLDGVEIDIPVIYTGPIDELFSCVYGALPYRSLRFEWRHDENVDSFQPAPVVAYPQEPGYTRITEYKKLPVQTCNGTSYAIEYSLPYEEGKQQEPYYPVLTGASIERYNKYKTLADGIPSLHCCGRLGDFKYYNMDQALARALEICEKL